MRAIYTRVLLGVVLFLSACSSVATLGKPCPYGGTRVNYYYIAECEPFNHGMPVCDVGKPLAVVDFLPSLLVDTLVSPVQGIRYATSDNAEQCKFR